MSTPLVHPAFAGPLSGTGGHSLDQTGSLLRMFKSEGFDAHMHISYLFKMKDNQGVQDYLTNELYSMVEKDVDFYLPELCLMALSRPSHEKLHAFLLDKAASKMYYAVKIHWVFQSAVEDPHKLSSVLLENAMKLYQESEMAVVNSRVYSSRVMALRRSDSLSLPNSGPASPSMRRSPLPVTLEDDDTSTTGLLNLVRSLSRHVTVEATENGLFDASLAMYRDLGDAVPSSTSHWRGGAIAAAEMATSPKRRNELDAFMLKQLRCDCFNLQNAIVTQLTRLSNNLVFCSSSADRRKSLNLAMAQVNHWLFDRRLAIALSGEETYMTGVALPLPTVTHEFTHILKVHVDDCKVFRTRQRAPYLVTVEVVDFSDLINQGSMAQLVGEELRRAAQQGVDDLSGAEEEEAEALTDIASLLRAVKSIDITRMLYPSNLVGENRRASIAPGGQDVTEAPVIVVDDANVTVMSSPDKKLSKKELKRSTIALRQALWGELHEDRAETLRLQSVYGALPSWRLEKIIVKGGDDVRQEVLAGQLVSLFGDIFQAARLPLWLRPYEVVVTSTNSGLIEMIPNTISIDGLKKEFANIPSFGVKSLNEIFTIVFADHLEEAQLNFIESCAAYCVVSYLLQIKDRHNGNLLLDSDGHLIHIDFGFMLSNAPGGSFALESSPFKLTQEYIDVMGGEYSPHFETFRTLIIRAFLEARKHRDQIVHLVRIVGECNPKLPCFASIGVEATITQMSDRFAVNLTEEACIERVVGLIDESINNWRTTQYDNFQRISNGIW